MAPRDRPWWEPVGGVLFAVALMLIRFSGDEANSATPPSVSPSDKALLRGDWVSQESNDMARDLPDLLRRR